MYDQINCEKSLWKLRLFLFERREKMSYRYDQYLNQHKSNVKKGFDWIRDNIPDLINTGFDFEWQIGLNHDQSKTEQDEYNAYDAYFYGGNRSFSVVQDFKKAWLLHIHRNPHHWQYWILINDDPDEGTLIMDMPDNYIIEMICDWWAFSWSKGNLNEIFKWYDDHKEYIKLSIKTRQKVEDILYQIRKKLDEKAE